MQKTEHYQLNQWDAGDTIRREDFNADNQKIDAALASGVNFSLGSYTGNGNSGKANMNTLHFDFEPQLLIVISPPDAYSAWFMIAARGMNQVHTSLNGSTNDFDSTNLIWSGNTVSYYADISSYPNYEPAVQFNIDGKVYHYIALG